MRPERQVPNLCEETALSLGFLAPKYIVTKETDSWSLERRQPLKQDKWVLLPRLLVCFSEFSSLRAWGRGCQEGSSVSGKLARQLSRDFLGVPVWGTAATVAQ